MNHLAIRNWKEYQHYKDRRPPWVKLHVHVLTDERLNALSPTSRLVAFLMLAIAANRDNVIPDDPAWLAVECSISRAQAKRAIADLLAATFIVRASTPASNCASDPASNSGAPALDETLDPHARPPAHGETERETESSKGRTVVEGPAANGTPAKAKDPSPDVELAIGRLCELRRADAATAMVVRSLYVGKLPAAAFHAAREAALENAGGDIGYAMKTLRLMVEEGQYASTTAHAARNGERGAA